MFSHTGGCLCGSAAVSSVARPRRLPLAFRMPLTEGTPANTDRGMNAEDERAVEHVLNTAFEVHTDGKTFTCRPPLPPTSHLLAPASIGGKSSSRASCTHPLRGLPRRMTSQRSSRRPRPAMT